MPFAAPDAYTEAAQFIVCKNAVFSGIFLTALAVCALAVWET
jgi:hypothetical protein